MGEGASCLRSGPESDGGGGMTKFQNCQEKNTLLTGLNVLSFLAAMLKSSLFGT
jgi:hypothetical protein